ncbi:hypothetical protein AYO20_04562 [Fonsecaea nubica]|uniref:Integral membrane protein n=1 Tax=Fonsecaea nubica TaxID=856822 RepID=A0A178D202_9EURO|nr:hypothetical protein AYO20_04562 [Fonsecaea nubica]OAL36148.1 hypothetical protein AYO20_04562 [Fonsecaea nubica]
MPPRNRHFRTREPFRHDNRLTLQRAEGPFGFLNPTRAHFNHSGALSKKTTEDVETSQENVHDEVEHETHQGNARSDVPAKNIRFLWRSRDNRKGRHPLLVQRPKPGEEAYFVTPRRTSDPREVLKNIVKTFTYYPVWDISWLVAFIFTWGSVVWVMNGFFVWLPVVAPSTEFDGEIYYGGGVTAFIGAILFFEVGSVLLIFEAINANNTGCFGWAVEQLLDDDGPQKHGAARLRVVANRHRCLHHHQNRRNMVGKPSKLAVGDAQSPDKGGKKAWQWFPSWHDLRTHYFHELGFLAGSAQLFGATVFGISGITALPGIINHLTPQWRLNAAYWIPQVIGGSGFIVSSTLYMLETQQKWYKPAPHLLGWHIAFWNLVGAFGFTLCGCLGMAYKNSGAQYEAGLATFWGSWAFLIGSYLQLYESLNKNPVEEVSTEQDFARRQ